MGDLYFHLFFCFFISKKVLESLEERYGDLYTASNVIMSPTHSHSTPGGFHTYYMYSIPSGGFETPTYTTLVNGIVTVSNFRSSANTRHRNTSISYQSIVRAHDDLQPARMFVAQGDLTDASVNRSPYAYDQNPEEEKAE
jgi:neutral ceramidase